MATVTVLRNPSTIAPLDNYDPGPFFCELLGDPEHRNRNLTTLWHRLQQLELTDLAARAKDAERELFMLGITFTVYSDRNAIDRILPFDVIPRVITASDWGAARRRHQAAGQGAQHVHLGHVSRAPYFQGRHPPRRPGARQFQLPPGDGGLQPSGGHLYPCRRHRYHPRRDRPLPGAGRQQPHAVRASPMSSRTGT